MLFWNILSRLFCIFILTILKHLFLLVLVQLFCLFYLIILFWNILFRWLFSHHFETLYLIIFYSNYIILKTFYLISFVSTIFCFIRIILVLVQSHCLFWSCHFEIFYFTSFVSIKYISFPNHIILEHFISLVFHSNRIILKHFISLVLLQ